jgi:sec-independent protein translocase protein TatA
MSIGFWQIAVVVILVVLLFGRGKISSLMGYVDKVIKIFKKGMATDVTEDSEPKNVSDDVTENLEPKNVSENNQDSNNKD